MVIHPHWNTCSLYDFGPILKISSKSVNTLWLWLRDAISCHRTWSALVQVMVSCLTAPSHYLKQYWLIITWRIKKNRQYCDLTVQANIWSSIYVGVIIKLSFLRIHLKKYVARPTLCCVLSHRYRYRPFNQYCSGLLHWQWDKHIIASINHNYSGLIVKNMGQ